jgi:hypothetical protein
VKASGQYKRNHPTGVHRTYYLDESRVYVNVSSFAEGDRLKEEKHYSEKGVLIYQQEHDKYGTLLGKGPIENGKRHGLWETPAGQKYYYQGKPAKDQYQFECLVKGHASDKKSSSSGSGLSPEEARMNRETLKFSYTNTRAEIAKTEPSQPSMTSNFSSDSPDAIAQQSTLSAPLQSLLAEMASKDRDPDQVGFTPKTPKRKRIPISAKKNEPQ